LRVRMQGLAIQYQDERAKRMQGAADVPFCFCCLPWLTALHPSSRRRLRAGPRPPHGRKTLETLRPVRSS